MRPGKTPGYDPRGFPPVAVTVDVVVFAIDDDALKVLLIERGVDPFLGCQALPGGFVQPGDRDLDQAARRELEEETGVAPREAYLEQLGSYGAVDRDPRMRVVSVAYWAACSGLPDPRGGSDAARADLVPVSPFEDGLVELAFDHGKILEDALDRLRAKLEYTAVGVRFCGSEFTISELRRVYEVVWNTTLDAGNFQRKVRYNGAFREVGREQDVAPMRHVDAAVSERETEGAVRFEGQAGRGDALASHGPRGGRPASLWTADDPAAMLNSPIARPGATGRSGHR